MGNKNNKYQIETDECKAVKSVSYISLDLHNGNESASVRHLLDNEGIVNPRPLLPVTLTETRGNDHLADGNSRNASSEVSPSTNQSQFGTVELRASSAKRERIQNQRTRITLNEASNDKTVGLRCNQWPIAELRKESSNDATSTSIVMRQCVNSIEAVCIDVDKVSDADINDNVTDVNPTTAFGIDVQQKFEETLEGPYEIPELSKLEFGTNKRWSSFSSDSAYSDKSSASVSSIEYMLEVYEKRIVRGVKYQDVLPYLLCIGESEKMRIEAIGKTDPVKAMHELLDALKRSQTLGKHQSFIDALVKTEYVGIAKLLKGECDKTYDEQHALILVLTPYHSERIYSSEMVNKLYERGIISESDMHEIENQSTPREAGNILLRRIHTKLPNWFPEFVQVCSEFDLNDVVELLCPTDATETQTTSRTDSSPNTLQCFQQTVKQVYSNRNGIPLPPPPVPERRPLHNISHDLKRNEYKPRPPTSMPPKKPHYHNSTIIEDNNPVDESPHQSTDSDNEVYTECGSRNTNHTTVRRRKKNSLGRKFKKERKHKALRREIQGSSDTVEKGLYYREHQTTSTANTPLNTPKQHMPDKLCGEQTGVVKQSTSTDNANRDYQNRKARIKRLDEHVNVEKQETHAYDHNTDYITQNESEADTDPGYEMADDIEHESPQYGADNDSNCEPEYDDAFSITNVPPKDGYKDESEHSDDDPPYDIPPTDVYNAESSICKDNPDYDEAGADVLVQPQQVQAVPQIIIDFMNSKMEEVKAHVSEEIQKLRVSNMCDYTDGYRRIYPNDQMMVYNSSQTYQGMFSPMYRVPSVSLFSLDTLPQCGYSNWNGLAMNIVDSN